MLQIWVRVVPDHTRVRPTESLDSFVPLVELSPQYFEEGSGLLRIQGPLQSHPMIS